MWAFAIRERNAGLSHRRRPARQVGMCTEEANDLQGLMDGLLAATRAVERAVMAIEGQMPSLESGASQNGAPAEAILTNAAVAVAGNEPTAMSSSQVPALSSSGQEQPDAAPAASEAVNPVTVDVLRDWLAARGVGLLAHRRPEPADAPLDRVALELGDQLELLGPLPRALRQVASSGRSRTLHLRDETGQTIGAVTALAARLHDLGLLAFCRYERSTRQLHLRAAESAAGFLAGGWLERWTATRAQSALVASASQGLVLRGVEIQLPDGQTAELDVVVGSATGARLWIECRTGTYQDRLDRDVRLRRALGLEPVEAIIVLAEATPEACIELSVLHGLHVTTPALVDEALRGALDVAAPIASATGRSQVGNGARAAAASHAWPLPSGGPAEDGAAANAASAWSAGDDGGDAEAQPPTPAASAARRGDVQRILTLLRRCGLRPHPQERLQTLQALVVAVAEGPARLPKELRVEMAERTGLSRSAANDLLLALVRGGGLLGSDGQPLANRGSAVGALASDDPVVLDACCQRAWRAAVCAQDPTLLGSAEGERAFREAVAARRGPS